MRVSEPLLTDLLDDRPLNGEIEVRTWLGPSLGAVLVDKADLSDAHECVRALCEIWGGACFHMHAVTRGQLALPDGLLDDVTEHGVTSIGRTHLLAETADTDTAGIATVDPSVVGQSLLLALLAAGDTKDWTVSLARIDASNAWAIAYLAVIGDLQRDNFDPQWLHMNRLRTDLSWTDVINVEVDESPPGADDLLARLRTAGRLPPSMLSCGLLGVQQARRDSGIGGGLDYPLPTPFHTRAMIGPNLVVVYEPGSVSDLALLWNLRAAHGLPRGLPLGVPATEDVAAVLSAWWNNQAMSYFGLGGDRGPRLISTSVDRARLEEFAAGTHFEAADWRDFTQLSRRPGRAGRQLARFQDGSTRIPAWSPDDRTTLGDHLAQGDRPRLRFTVSLATRYLPPGKQIRDTHWTENGCREWGYQDRDPEPDDFVDVRWPSGWRIIEGLLADRGLTAKKSAAGLVSATFLARMGSMHQLMMLQNSSILEELQRLGTARSMTWFRDRAREIATAAANPEGNEAPLEAIERVLNEMTVRPSEADQPDITIERFRAAFGGDRRAAARWIGWAEKRGLLVRGVSVACTTCGASSWRHLGEIAPPILCRGCGEAIGQPFPEGELKFRYRASEPLLRVIEHDALPHLLALRFFCGLWGTKFNDAGYLYGGYPGVDIYEAGSDARIGEADVLLVLSNGELVPGECKRRGTGLTEPELSKLERLSARLEAPWSFVATPDWGENCPAIWPEGIRFAPNDSPRLALTAEHLLAPFVSWPMGTNIFEWNPRDQDARREDHKHFADWVRESSQGLETI